MPVSWWAMPDKVVNDRSSEAAFTFDKLMTQIWYFQLEALLHLPCMLKVRRRYDYSKFSCLMASREMMWRYLALRSAENRSSCCKVVDFSALTATVTLFLGLLEPVIGPESQDRKSDRNFIQTVLESMEALSQRGRDFVATQSASVIKSLLAVDSRSDQSHGNLKLTIPYFGTISIVRPNPIIPIPPSPPATALPYILPSESQAQNQPHQLQQPHTLTMDHNQSPPRDQRWPTHNSVPQNSMSQRPHSLPLVSFTGSQFPPMPPKEPQEVQDWGLPQEMDTLFFDSLLNTDLEGNWIF
ncbi:uncharacterized protein L3040_000557 [Drepanopeziza brunnea f. sp. 'multigermtubi']|nr:hypothetical protein L3040_000557 [Drepanopeziza brunnea f. sp. 'multigermtubi']